MTANQVTLTFAGDSDQLERAFAKVGTEAEQAAARVKAASEQTEAAGRVSAESFDRAAEATDTLDTRAMGFRDTLTGVEDSMAGTAALARGDLFEGLLLAGFGVGDLASGATNLLVPAMKNARESAGRVASFLRGPWGLALGGAAAAIGIITTAFIEWRQRQQELEKLSKDFADSLSAVDGAITGQTRVLALNRLEQEGAAAAAESLGIEMNDLVDAALGNERAWASVQDQLEGLLDPQRLLNDEIGRGETELHMNRQRVEEVQKALEGARGEWRRSREVVDETTDAIESQTSALQELADQNRAMVDPVFAARRAWGDLEEAQQAVTDAVRDFGANSPEARRALLDQAEAAFDLNDAAITAAESGFDGALTPSMKTVLENAGLTEKEMRRVERALGASAEAADAWAKDYEATFRISGIAALQQANASLNLFASISRSIGIPFFHEGGTVPGAPGQEILAVLQAGEEVIPAGGGGGTGVTLRFDFGSSSGSGFGRLLKEEMLRALRTDSGFRAQVAARVA